MICDEGPSAETRESKSGRWMQRQADARLETAAEAVIDGSSIFGIGRRIVIGVSGGVGASPDSTSHIVPVALRYRLVTAGQRSFMVFLLTPTNDRCSVNFAASSSIPFIRQR
ncbi:unnamed protein product [Darwinula stevensoni]|uniref:Uncharacterized protein n=1 Tax=Darwinula stevensoni TaxID=69355 RepID=A0A7R9ACE4_9CRUS|nr:unnamed protein product [Darwinula stevensoni]CAG0900105.1 unnamed protein product [Darwinula stevensoni]